MREFFSPDYLLYAGDKFVKLAAIIIIAIVACRVFGALVDRFFHHETGVQKYIEEKRARTLSAVLKMVIRYTLYFIATVMVLQEFQINTTSILAGAGIVGLAVGVGAQSLVRDIVTGFFVILEDQYSVGDYIVSGGMEGTVEEIGFRVTKLRDGNGVLHIIPNGAISRVSNHTRGHTLAVVNVPVAYEADIDKVLAILKEAGSAIAEAMPEVLAEPEVVGIVDLKPGEVIVRMVARTTALTQEKVETALRHKIKLLLEAAEIPAPYASRAAKQERLEGRA